MVQPVFALPGDFDSGTHAVRVSTEVMQWACASIHSTAFCMLREKLGMPLSLLTYNDIDLNGKNVVHNHTDFSKKNPCSVQSPRNNSPNFLFWCCNTILGHASLHASFLRTLHLCGQPFTDLWLVF